MANRHLEGYRVVDFSAVFAGPICARYLHDCGAEVIKVETPGVGDLTRGVDGITQVFAHFNAGKQSVALNLKDPEAQRLARRLVAGADVLLQNFRPGIMAKFGLDYDSLQDEFPQLIYCSISGFGQSGPQVDRAAYAPVIHAASGFDSVHAHAQTGQEGRPPNWEIMVADILTGAYAFGAIQTALLGRVHSGEGEHIDVSMMEAMMTLIPAHLQAAQMPEPPAIGRFHPVATSDGYVMLCVVSDKNLECLAAAIDRPDLLSDPRFVRGPRTEHFKQLMEEVEHWSSGLSSVACEDALNRAGVPCSRYQSAAELFDHPQVLHRKSFSAVEKEELGEFLIQSMPFAFASAARQTSPFVASLGEHTDQVLRQRLGLSQQEIDRLRERGAIA